ncbi:hypothetical protein MUK42_36755 [Musa troglodytarum]|uniref:Uncharacterized protein n=1 Tax=Musa troglodytarum TaxID=320322 RepID=A0A9E7G4Q1_9LILI|nr:hypothetical protein MUK42_36755 [Musa troglodytarum]
MRAFLLQEDRGRVGAFLVEMRSFFPRLLYKHMLDIVPISVYFGGYARGYGDYKIANHCQSRIGQPSPLFGKSVSENSNLTMDGLFNAVAVSCGCHLWQEINLQNPGLRTCRRSIEVVKAPQLTARLQRSYNGCI